jgi:hypothetical protein
VKHAVWLDTIRKNAISFRDIHYFGDMNPPTLEICDILLDRCHSLVSIMLRISGWHFCGPVCYWEETLRPLIEQNRTTLRQLDLHLTLNLPVTFLPSLLVNLPHLRSLVLSTRMMLVEDVFSIPDGCPSSLERLALRTTLTKSKLNKGDSVNDPDYSSILSVAKPLQLKSFHMPYSDIQGTMEAILSRLAAHSQELRIETRYCLRITPTV